jgi:hypothetical protein
MNQNSNDYEDKKEEFFNYVKLYDLTENYSGKTLFYFL